MPIKKYLLLEIQRWQVFVAVKLVEVGAEKAVLGDAVFFKLSLGIFLSAIFECQMDFSSSINVKRQGYITDIPCQ